MAAWRLTFARELTMKLRHFGTDYIDEPTAEGQDEAEVLPMLMDAAAVFQILALAAEKYQGGTLITATVARILSRNTKHVSDMVRQAASKAEMAAGWPPLAAHHSTPRELTGSQGVL